MQVIEYEDKFSMRVDGRSLKVAENGTIVLQKDLPGTARLYGFDPAGKYVAVIGKNYLAVYEISTGDEIYRRPIVNVIDLKFEPGSGNRLFTLNLATSYEGESFTTIPIMKPEVK